MKKILSLTFLLCMLLNTEQLKAQCTVTAKATTFDVLCGDTVQLSAIAKGVTAFRNNFNCSAVQCPQGDPANPADNFGTWSFSSTAVFNNPCLPQTGNGTPHLWFNNASASPRQLSTTNLPLQTGGIVRFKLRLADPDLNGNASPCENPDAADEGVHLQYSNNNGATWTDIQYYGPNGGNDPVRTVWTEYTAPIPAAAQTNGTRIRWVQLVNTGSVGNFLDHWGMDDIEIIVNAPASQYTWAHTGIQKPTGDTEPVVPTSTTTYPVTYTDGVNTCTDQVTIVVRKQTISAAVIPNTPICPGDSVQLTSTNSFNPVPLSCGPSGTGCLGSTAQINIGTGNVAPGYNLLGAGGTGGTCLNDAGTPDRSIRTQFIIRASEMPAFFKGGQIYNLSLDLTTGGTPLSNFTIKMGCTSDSTFTSNTAWKTGLTEVYKPKGITLTAGINLFDFDQHYDWDGTSNIVIQICAFGSNGSGAVVKSTAKLANSVLFARTCRLDAGCEINVNQVRSANQPNVVLGVCYRPDPIISYSWTPTNGVANPNAQNTKTAPSTTTTYTITVRDMNTPLGCAVAQMVTVNVAPVGSVNAAFTPVCVGGALNLTATLASPITGVNYNWTGPGGFTSNLQNPTRNPAVAGRYYVTATNGNCTGRDSIDVVIDTPPNPGIPTDTKLCSNGSILDLFGQLAGEDAGGIWKDDNASGGMTGGMLNPKLIAANKLPGTFNYTYELNTNSCGLQKSTVKVTVEKLPNAGRNNTLNLCEDNGNVSLFSSLLGTPQNTGTWTDVNASGKMTGTDPNKVFNTNGLGGNTYNFRYTVAGVNPCPDSSATVTINVIKQVNSGLPIPGKVCVDATIDLNTLLTGQDAGGTWTKVGHNEGDAISGSSFKATNATPGTYTFEYLVKGTAPCTDKKTNVQLTINGSPVAANVLTTCEANLVNYKATFTISGGQQPYTVTPAGTISSTTPANFTSNLIPTGTAVTFNITDVNACKIELVAVTKDCQCKTQSGDMRSDTSLNVCENTPLDASALYQGGYVNDGNDTLMYYLHEGNSNTLVNVIAKSHLPIFTFNPATMNYASTYFVSAVAGNVKADNSVDEADVCLSVSPGTPVRFIQLPNATIAIVGNNPICPGGISTIEFNYSTNNDPFTINYTANGVATSVTGMDNVNKRVNVNPIVNTTYSLTSITDKFGCSQNANGSVLLNVNQSAQAVLSAGNTLCSDGNQNLGSLLINLVGQAPFNVYLKDDFTGNSTPIVVPTSSFNFSPNTWDANTAINYSLDSVIDASGSICNAVVSGTVSIYPTPSATISGDSIYCGGQSIQLKFVLTGIGPWDITYTQNGTNSKTINVPAGQRNYTETINNPGLAAGNYVFALTAVIDKGSAQNCSGTFTGAANVTINQAPTLLNEIVDFFSGTTVAFNPNDTVCEGTSRRLKFTTTGAGNQFNMTYNLNGVPNNQPVRNGDLIVLPNAAGTYILNNFTITDTTKAKCSSTGNSVSLVVNKNPTLDFQIPVTTLCQGIPVQINLITSGNRGLNVEVEETSSAGTRALFFNTSQAQSPQIVSAIPLPGVIGLVSYRLKRITDGSNPTCIAQSNKKIDININQAPTANFGVSAIEVCQGTAVTLPFTFTGAPGTGVRGVITELNNNLVDSVQSPSTSKTINNLAPGDYRYQFTRVYDLSSAQCLGTGNLVNVKVRATPAINLSLNKNIVCENEVYVLNINPVAGGNLPYTVRYSTPLGIDTTITALNNNIVINYFGIQSGSFQLLSLSDNTTTNPGGTKCFANTFPKVDLTVNPLPAGIISGAQDICAGEAGALTIFLSGNPPFKVEFQDDQGNTYTLPNGKVGVNDITDLLPKTNSVYTIKNFGIIDGNPLKQCINGGQGIATINVHPTPIPSFTASTAKGCSPVNASFTNTTTANFTPTSAKWELGNGTETYDLNSANATYDTPGTYNVSLTIVSAFGCEGKTTLPIVEVYPDPVAAFVYNPNQLTISNSTSRFSNLSTNAVVFDWNFGTGDKSTSFSPNYSFPPLEDQTYTVCLAVKSPFGCVDTTCQDIFVQGEVLVNIPNSFTPNEDGINDSWIPIHEGLRVDFQDLKIFTRWGELIYETQEIDKGWNGILKGTGELAPSGIYIYKLLGKSRYDGNKLEYSGKINLMK